MKFPQPILDDLASRNIKRPTPIQMQGLPVALAGRDMVGIAFTGSGKSLTFALPLVMASLEEEIRMPLVGGEGPVGIILAPSRELVRQTFDIVKGFCEAMGRSGQYPPLRAQLVIGGESAREQLEPIREKGLHCGIARSSSGLPQEEVHHIGHLSLHLFGRGRQNARSWLRRRGR